MIPRGHLKWVEEAELLSLERESIHTTGQKSASKIEFEQFLLLHVVWPETMVGHVLRRVCLKEGWLERDSIRKAAQFLGNLESWKTYVRSFDLESRNNGQRYEESTFALVRRHQVRTAETKASTFTPKVEFSPRPGRVKTAARLQDPGPPKTPTPRRSGLDSLKGLQYAIGQVDDPMTPQAPVSAKSLSHVTPFAAPLDDPGFQKAVRDEETVNIALISFLEALTIHYQGLRCQWWADRCQFVVRDGQGEKVYEARVDGALLDDQKRPRIIVEVKPFRRRSAESETSKIRMQESAQMAAWISEHPPITAHRKPYRRVLVSQDRHEIYITIATFDAEYVNYIRCKEPTRPSLKNTKGPSLMVMQEFGPFSVQVKKQMEEFGLMLLALSIEEDAGWWYS